MWGYTRELLKRFREEIVQKHRGIRCREIAGQKVLPIDEIEYTYTVLCPREIHLWREPRKAEYPYWYSPWCDYPYWSHHHRYPYRH
jgi:starvation-inducible outer membrane lipoprotein